MNIFILDNDPIKAAQYHNDNHVRKMILESAVLMALSYPESDSLPKRVKPYWQKTQKNNHCTKWTRATTGNYNFVARLALALCEEYTYRTGKNHATHIIVKWLAKHPSPTVPQGPQQPHTLAITNDCKLYQDPVEAYREYYKYYKYHLAKWTKRPRPDWYVPNDYMI